MLDFVLSYFTLTNVTVFVLALPVLFYLYMTRNYGFYEAKGLKSVKPEFFYGNRRPLTTGEMSMPDYYMMLYNNLKEQR